MFRQVPKLIDIPVGEVRGSVRIMIVDGDVDQCVFRAAIDPCVCFKSSASIGQIALMVFIHQAELVDHSIFDRPALQDRHIYVVRIFQAQSAARQSSHAPQVAQLRSKGGPDRRILLRR
jgi:hypothetical protein